MQICTDNFISGKEAIFCQAVLPRFIMMEIRVIGMHDIDQVSDLIVQLAEDLGEDFRVDHEQCMAHYVEKVAGTFSTWTWAARLRRQAATGYAPAPVEKVAGTFSTPFSQRGADQPKGA
jgi:hypothetical protein